MEIFAGLSVLLLVLVSLFIAVKTFRLWLRTRGLPELLLTIMLLSATVLGYPLVIAGTRISSDAMWPVLLSGQTMMCIGYACLLLFTLNVFRPTALWAKVLVALTMLLILGVSVSYFIEVTGDNPPEPGTMSATTRLTSLPIAIAYFWTMIESLSYHRRMRLQVRLGLTDVVVANRVLLWGLMCLAAGVAVVISNVAMAMQGMLLSPPIVLVCSVLGLAHAGCLFLAFHPPDWYRSWLVKGPAAEAS